MEITLIKKIVGKKKGAFFNLRFGKSNFWRQSFLVTDIVRATDGRCVIDTQIHDMNFIISGRYLML